MKGYTPSRAEACWIVSNGVLDAGARDTGWDHGRVQYSADGDAIRDAISRALLRSTLLEKPGSCQLMVFVEHLHILRSITHHKSTQLIATSST